MNKATRSKFTQAGAEVQKIDQGGTWAVIESSYHNEYFDDRDCEDDFYRKYGPNFASMARWVYRCRRVVKKHRGVFEKLQNGEILHPCYNIEPSTYTRYPDGMLVWLEPLPQLNGFVFIPGGKPELPQCEERYPDSDDRYRAYSDYVEDYQGSGSDYSSYYSSDYGSYYGSDYVSDYEQDRDLLNCLDCLSRLCVARDSYGYIVDIFYINEDGEMIKVPDCDSHNTSAVSESSGGSGGGGGNTDCNNCKPPQGAPYQFEYNITYGGDNYEGIEGPDEELGSGSGYFSDPCVGWSSNTSGYIPRLQGPNCNHGYPPSFSASLCCTGTGSWSFVMSIICPGKPNCLLYDDDVDILVTNCSPGPPTFTIAIKPGRCAQGYIVIRPQ